MNEPGGVPTPLPPARQGWLATRDGFCYEKAMRVLVIEDERKTASFIRRALQEEGFTVDCASAGEDGLGRALGGSYDAVVLDIMLPGRDGLSVLREMRARRATVPVLLLSARQHVDERIEGLNAGADDYLPKPFVLGELVARVRALGRRTSGPGRNTVLQLADLTLDTITREVKRGGKVIELAAREYQLLEYLLRSQGRVCGRMQILEKVWDYDFDPGTNMVDVYVRRVRDKIDAGFSPHLLHTVRGIGYVMRVAP